MNVLFLAAFSADAEKLASLSKNLWIVDYVFDNQKILSCLEKKDYDFLLFDFEAGDAYPPDILKKIYTQHPTTPIFLLSRQHCNFVEEKVSSSTKIAGCFAVPYNFDAMHTAIYRILYRKTELLHAIPSPSGDMSALYTKLQGHSPAIQGVRNFILDVVRHNGHILLSGESGSGKEVVASLIYRYSQTCTDRYISINASCIADELAESLLFGSCKGAYTGAVDSDGLFSQVHNGTLFLDEIENLSLDLQGKLLRVLETHEYYKLGGSKKHHSEFRLICATNCDLQEMIREGRFRLDLYYRLDVFHLTLPPLRTHKEDIALLADNYLQKDKKSLSDEALHLLYKHSWPGNVRELFNCLDRAVFAAKGSPFILPQHFDF